MKYAKIKKVILKELKDKLPKHLSYHSVLHVQDVLAAVEEIGIAEGVDPRNLKLLKTAALFHDAGFLNGAKDHEEKSCEIAQEQLPKYGYTQEDIDIIKGMIMATKIPQSPKTKLEEILADADLDYLGRDDFFVIGDKLFEELSMFGIVHSEDDWNRLQEKFLENHHFFTPTNIQRRNTKKQNNLNIIKDKLTK